MCTVTIHRTATSLTVTMNRDEARSRGPELPPERCEEGPETLLAPRDSDCGGMWMAVNTSGVVACLLNAYFPGDVSDHAARVPAPSRGDIIPGLLRHGSLEDVRDVFDGQFDPSPYPSFTLLMCSLDRVLAQTWTGEKLLSPRSLDDEWTLLVSSSYRSEDVTAWRCGAFAQWRDAGCPMLGHLPTFHVLHPEGEESLAPLMDRKYSTTRSITQVALTRGLESAALRYWLRSALPNGAPQVEALPLKQRPAAVTRG